MFFASGHDDADLSAFVFGENLDRLAIRECQIEVGSAPGALVTALNELHDIYPSARWSDAMILPSPRGRVQAQADPAAAGMMNRRTWTRWTRAS
jgi:hypothetical protein